MTASVILPINDLILILITKIQNGHYRKGSKKYEHLLTLLAVNLQDTIHESG